MSNVSSTLAKQPFLSHSLPHKILPDLSWMRPSDSHFFGFRNNSFFFLRSKVVSFASNRKPGGPGLCIYVFQWQGGPFIPPDTGFPFSRLLRLAGLRWRYSNPPPHGTSNIVSRDWVWLQTGFRLMIGFTEHLQNVTTNNYDSLTGLHTPKITVNYRIHKVFLAFPNRCLVATCNVGRSPSSVLPKGRGPQLPASNSSSSPSVHWLTHNCLHKLFCL
jgi:hypothetical protein